MAKTDSVFLHSLANPLAEAAYWEDLLESEDQLDSQNEWLRFSRGLYASWIEKYLPSNACGERVLKTDAFEEIRGREIVQALESRFKQVVVTDIAGPALRQGARRTNSDTCRWVQTPVQELPFATASFDAVVSFSTLDHFQTKAEISDSLAELARLTRPGGKLLMTLDNAANPLVSLRNALPNGLLAAANLAPYRYGETLGPWALRRELNRAGWKIRTLTSVLHAPRAIAVAAASRIQDANERRRFDRHIRSWEAAETLPTRFFTGYFLLACCERSA